MIQPFPLLRGQQCTTGEKISARHGIHGMAPQSVFDRLLLPRYSSSLSGSPCDVVLAPIVMNVIVKVSFGADRASALRWTIRHARSVSCEHKLPARSQPPAKSPP